MNQIENTLEADETIRHIARHHWLFALRSLGTIPLTQHTVITQRRLIHRSGLLAIKLHSLDLCHIERRELHQSLLGRVLGYGSVRLYITGGPSLRLEGIRHPALFVKALTTLGADAPAKGQSREHMRPKGFPPFPLPHTKRGR